MTKAEAEKQLIADLAAFAHDPYGFVLYAFAWGKGDLTGKSVLPWQRDILQAMGKGLITVQQAIQLAVSSGNGVGKSALVAWVILWALSTRENTRGVVTANTATQLATKTWPELSVWYHRFIARHWFIFAATSIHCAIPKYEKTWRMDAIPWSKSNSEAFAGLHNKGKRIVLIFDEASAIPDVIWEVSEGALTDAETEIIWAVFGNPTRNSGRFYDCFHKLKDRWIRLQVDSRTVDITNKIKIKTWIEDYGEDSDFVLVHVRGEFPSVGDRQFISPALVEAARAVVLRPDSQDHAVRILTLDGAWGGGAEIVCGCRQGLCFRIMWVQSKNDDDFALARRFAATEDQVQADACLIDQAYGTGVYSYGRQMNRKWTLVPFGGAAMDADQYVNKRAEMYGLGKNWLRSGGQLPNDPVLAEQICAPEQIFRDDGKILLERKEDILERVGDVGRADAWALSFSMPVKRRDAAAEAIAAASLASARAAWHPWDGAQQSDSERRRVPLK